MNKDRLDKMCAAIEPWKENFGEGMERRGTDGQSWYDLSVNMNSAPCEKSICIIVTSWMGQLKWLKGVLTQYRQVPGAFVILAYDNPFYAWAEKNHIQMMRCMPNPMHYLLANAVVHKHITYDSDKRNGWFWDVRYAQGIVKQFPNIKHVYVTNGDCAIERPEGFPELIEILGDAELMAGQNNGEVIHTADMLFTVDAFHRVFDYMAEVFRVPVIGSRSPESTLLEAVKNLGIRNKPAPEQPKDPRDGTVDCYACFGQDSTFKRVIGFRNLFAEYETAGNMGREPIDGKYVDSYQDWIYFGGEERETICRYWETGDRRYLYQYWDRWEDSWYNRLYYPIGHYGKEPIYAPKSEAAGTGSQAA